MLSISTHASANLVVQGRYVHHCLSVSKVCLVEFTLSEYLHHCVTFSSHFAVPPVVTASSQQQQGFEGERVTIDFSIEEASPEVEPSGVRWFFLRSEEDIEATIEITEASTLGDATLEYSDTRLSLTISGLTQEVAGRYTITVSNPAGTGSAYTVLTVQGMQKCTTHLICILKLNCLPFTALFLNPCSCSKVYTVPTGHLCSSRELLQYSRVCHVHM